MVFCGIEVCRLVASTGGFLLVLCVVLLLRGFVLGWGVVCGGVYLGRSVEVWVG